VTARGIWSGIIGDLHARLARRSDAGKTVAELSHDQIKGGHITRAQACERAIDNAVARLTGALKQKLAGLGM